MKLTDSYFEARREAIKWLNVAPAKLNYTQGVLILQKSGSKPQVAALLARKGAHANATVTLCHTGTPDIAAYTRTADVVVVAAGRPNTLTGDMLKPGAVVIDVGVNRVPDATKPKGYRLCGDADYEAVSKVASAITPVPGGVGPMTIAMLMRNTVTAAKAQSR